MIFRPTATSQALIKAVRGVIKRPTILDLGCGNGNVGASLLDLGEVFASDIDQEAVDSIYTAKMYGIYAHCGSLFEPWGGMKFDIIVDDVSGVAEKIAKISPWFDGVPCDSGDGSDLLIKVLEQAPDYLEKSGKLFFPIVSLSNIDRALKVAKEIYNIELLSHNEFPLPKEMYKHIDLIKSAEGVKIKEKFGMITFFTDIYKGELKTI